MNTRDTIGQVLDERWPERPDPNKVNKAYQDLVMQVWADMDHADRRDFLEKKAEVERAARRRL